MIDYSDRYSSNWGNVSVRVKQSQSPYKGCVKCACCGRVFPWENTETHHLYYLSNTDGEPGLNLVAVCGSTQKPGSCHHKLHQPNYYIKDPINPKWGNRNTPEIIAQLQANWRVINQEINGVVSYPTTYNAPTHREQYKKQLVNVSRVQKVIHKPVSVFDSLVNAFSDLVIPLGVLFIVILLFIYTV